MQYGPRVAALGAYLWHGQFLSRDRACAALGEMFGCAPSAAAIAAMTARIVGLLAPGLDAIARALIASDVAHFDETGFRVAGGLAWVHSASSGKFALVTVHAGRGRRGMDAAGVACLCRHRLPSCLCTLRRLRRRGRLLFEHPLRLPTFIPARADHSF